MVEWYYSLIKRTRLDGEIAYKSGWLDQNIGKMSQKWPKIEDFFKK